MADVSSSEGLFEVEFEPVGRRVRAGAGETLLAAAQSAGVELVAVCGGAGVCGTCRVQCVSGDLSPTEQEEKDLFDEEELSSGWRLACRARPGGNVVLEIPPSALATAQRLQLEGSEVADGFDPATVAHEVCVDRPGPDDLRSDWSRFLQALSASGIELVDSTVSVVQHCSERLRALNWQGRVAVRECEDRQEVVAVLGPQEPLLGLAIDIGTTKVAVYLVDLEDGSTLTRAGSINPQIAFGEDVVSRIAYANEGKDQESFLRSRLVDALNELADQLRARVGAARHQVAEAVIVGNTAMHHLLAGLSVRQLGEAPYVPVVSTSLTAHAGELGLHIAPGAAVYLPPNIAGYVGADHVSMLLACDILHLPGVVVALDIGTNTEITLSVEGRLFTCSCASGPAFEGAHVRDGMRAVPGAIERVQVLDSKFHVHTVGEQLPVGICGSGILDTVAAMLDARVIDDRGSVDASHPRVRRSGDELQFVLVPAPKTGHGRDIVVTRKDVHEIQLAKGAIRAGIEILLKEAELSAADIDTIVVAGAFGTYLDLESAIRVGMFPNLTANRFEQVGNAAGMGAIRMLRSRTARSNAEALIERIEYIELTTHAGFTDAFTDALFFDDFLTARRGDATGASGDRFAASRIGANHEALGEGDL